MNNKNLRKIYLAKNRVISIVNRNIDQFVKSDQSCSKDVANFKQRKKVSTKLNISTKFKKLQNLGLKKSNSRISAFRKFSN